MAKSKNPKTPPTSSEGSATGTNTIYLDGMYKDYFLDYASYVILERAIPAANDGFKPVQRRISHALKNIDDGRFHKVANVIGQTMQFHPHGDAAIGDALVKLGQKNLLLDTQGNWGDIRTGDSAAAPRYIETRLTKFALEVAFNAQTTDWQLSYDGRKKEPVHLPMKFPLLLAQGAEGIAVGLSTKIMPHNFIELIKASIKLLQDKKTKIYPDFQTGGMMDVTDYKSGKRGGKIRVRSRIVIEDKKTLLIKEIPYGVTTTQLIDSIVKANDKGKIKIKKVVDNTAKEVEIAIELAPGVSPNLTIDALYAFTNCEVSISPNACVIIDDKPHFLKVEDLLKISTDRTKELLKQELEIKKSELEEKWHFSSLEKIFIEKRIYRDIEESETWEAVLEAIDKGLKKYVSTPSSKGKKKAGMLSLHRDITEEDLIRLTEIKIKRISKYNSFKADELISKIEDDLKQVKHDLKYLTKYAIAYFERLLAKYGKGRERRTEITTFESVKAVQVVASNAKLYVNRKEGFIGSGMKKEEFVKECSDIDDIIAFRKDGKMMVNKIANKVFMGKNILHTDVWKKGDERTTYNMIYVDGKTGKAMAKRFNVKGITRAKEYDLTKGHPKSRVVYFSANPNGESEIVNIQLTPACKAKKKIFDFDFSELAIKGRSSGGNVVTKYPVRKVIQKEKGQSTLGALKLWVDQVSGKLNSEERGLSLGEFDTGDYLIAIYNDGTYELTEIDMVRKFDMNKVLFIGKQTDDFVISCIYYEGEKGWTMVKRFGIDTTTLDQRFPFITEHKDSKLYYATGNKHASVNYSFRTKSGSTNQNLDLVEFIDVKGWKALGNKLMDKKIIKISEIEAPKEDLFADQKEVVEESKGAEKAPSKATPKKTEAKKPAAKKTPTKNDKKKNIKPGDTIEFDL